MASSEENRKFNNFAGRAFITTVSIKKMSAKDTEWCLSPAGWFMEGEDISLNRQYDITKLEDSEEDREKSTTIRSFIRKKYIESYDEMRDISFNRTLLGDFSLKYRDYTMGSATRRSKGPDARSPRAERK